MKALRALSATAQTPKSQLERGEVESRAEGQGYQDERKEGEGEGEGGGAGARAGAGAGKEVRRTGGGGGTKGGERGSIRLPPTSDFHVHLRDGKMMELVVPTIREGGVDLVYVMPNLQPPITTVQQALEYQQKLEALAPNVTFLMTLYLHPSVTPATIREAKEAGIVGVKSYPQGVTTNSDGGVLDYASYYPVFAEMERLDMVLNLHGECPSTTSAPPARAGRLPQDQGDDSAMRRNQEEPITILTAEEAFLPTLIDLHTRFPRLRIVLEHCTTSAAISAVRRCGPTVAATITAHHLFLTVDDWAGDPFCYCKPVAKTPTDRRALLEAAVSGSAKFFFGSDSAPHPVSAKQVLLSHAGGADAKSDGHRTDSDTKKNKGLGNPPSTNKPSRRTRKPAAGIFTQKYCTQYVIDALQLAIEEGILAEEQVTQEILEGFLGKFGRAFYRVDEILRQRTPESTDSENAAKNGGEMIVITSGAVAKSGDKESAAAAGKAATKEGDIGGADSTADVENEEQGTADDNDGDVENDEDEEVGEETIQDVLSSDGHDAGGEEEIEVVIFRGGERTCRLRWEQTGKSQR